jgi:hypothetical protein
MDNYSNALLSAAEEVARLRKELESIEVEPFIENSIWSAMTGTSRRRDFLRHLG